jgi:hypothetical protein
MVSFMNIMSIPNIAVFISFILGLGLASMFRPICKGPDCLVIRGPPVQDVRDSVYQFGSRCVEFKTHTVECPKDGSPVVETVSFADYS